MKFPERVVVLGLPGSGKTTFAGALSAKLGIPHIEADNFFWTDDGAKRPDFRAAFEKELSKHPRWIAEGHYGKLRALLDPRLTEIVWLDFPLMTVGRRWLTRSIKTRDFADWPWLTYKMQSLTENYRSAVARAERDGKTVAHLTSAAEAELYLARLFA